MPESISKNQYDYLNGLVQGGGGNGEWAKAQLANSTYTPTATPAPAMPTSAPVPAAPTTASPTTGVIPNGSVPKQPTIPGAATTSPTNNPAVQQYTDFQKQQTELMNQLKSYMQPMNYDPNTDPAYLAHKQWSARQTDLKQQDALEGLTARGFSNVNNSMALQQSAQLAQDAQLADNAYSAQLEQQYYQRNRDRIADVFNLLQNSQNQQQRAYDNTNTDRNFGISQGQLTGYYSPDDATISSVKQKMAANSEAYASASPEEKNRLHEENVRLAAYIGGTDTTGNGDYAFGPMRTMQGQQLDYNQAADQRDFGLNQTQTLAQLTGYLPDGTPTNAKQQQDLQNLWLVAQQTGSIPDQLADLYGLPRGTRTQEAMQQAAQIAISQQNANTSAASASASAGNAAARLAWDKDPNNPDNLYKMSQIGKQGKTDGFTLSDYNKYIQQAFNKEVPIPGDLLGKTSKQFDSGAAYQYIIGLGLPDDQTDQLLQINGLPTK